MEVTIGGDRVGSGKKMKAYLHNYNRSTHNLSETFASSMASGVLYPALCKLGMRGDSFDISINADCRTIPTVGPLFGSYKMQVDVYQCPVRLYQGILHNNPLAIGLKMGQVKFPTMLITSYGTSEDIDNFKTNTSSLLHYLGLSGIGRHTSESADAIGRKINAIPALSYYDIFKTYYANKQEENAYVISGGTTADMAPLYSPMLRYTDGDGSTEAISFTETQYNAYVDIPTPTDFGVSLITFSYVNNTNEFIKIATDIEKISVTLFKYESNSYAIIGTTSLKNFVNTNDVEFRYTNDNTIILVFSNPFTYKGETVARFQINTIAYANNIKQNLTLKSFNISNIDDMRYDLLSHHELGTAYEIEGKTFEPYLTLTSTDDNDISLNTYPMNGLVLKTYQNDIFNNWLNTEWIEGENSITELTKVAIVDGAFSMDSLNFAQKQYNMLNRIAVAGATYEDWQDVVYEEVKRRQIESPIFVGGMSQEIVFDEIIQTAPADGNPLGTLGGRGKLAGNKKGGKIHVKCDEACFIIALVSLTPRIYYTQGNEFYLTDVFSMDDVHKPPMDGIGFQDLIGERMAWFDTIITAGSSTVNHRSKIGKLPAWIEYMTSYDRAHGDFADEKAGYMILSRRYEYDETYGIKDVTTYVDPQKYNYAFAYQNLDAQNFWVQIGFNIKARRLMSARLIPNV